MKVTITLTDGTTATPETVGYAALERMFRYAAGEHTDRVTCECVGDYIFATTDSRERYTLHRGDLPQTIQDSLGRRNMSGIVAVVETV